MLESIQAMSLLTVMEVVGPVLLLAILKHLPEAHNALKSGRWIHNDLRHTALMLEEKRVGILGLGRIGREGG